MYIYRRKCGIPSSDFFPPDGGGGDRVFLSRPQHLPVFSLSTTPVPILFLLLFLLPSPSPHSPSLGQS